MILKRKSLAAALVLVWIAVPAFGAAGTDVLTVEEAVTLAKANNALIREATARSQAAVQEHRAYRADLLPKASAAYRYARLGETPFMYFSTYNIVSGGPAVGGAGVITGSRRIEAATGPLDNFHWEASLTQPLFTGFALTTRVRMAEIGIEIGEVERQQAVADVVKQARLAFYDLLMAERMRDTARSAETTLEAHVADARQFYDQGLIAYNDLLQSQVALADAVQKKATAEAAVEMAGAALNTVIGRELEQPVAPAPVESLPGEPEPLPMLIEAAESRRPELRLLDLSLAKLDAGSRLAASAYYPTVALVGRYEQDGDNFRATDNDFRNSYNTTVAVQAEWTFFEWGKTRSEVAKLHREHEALAAKADGVRDSIRLEVKNARVNLAVALTNIRTAKAALDQADENLRITRLRFQQQVASATEVLDATTAQIQAQTNFHAARYSAWKAEAELERAVGAIAAADNAPQAKENP